MSAQGERIPVPQFDRRFRHGLTPWWSRTGEQIHFREPGPGRALCDAGDRTEGWTHATELPTGMEKFCRTCVQRAKEKGSHNGPERERSET